MNLTNSKYETTTQPLVEKEVTDMTICNGDLIECECDNCEETNRLIDKGEDRSTVEVLAKAKTQGLGTVLTNTEKKKMNSHMLIEELPKYRQNLFVSYKYVYSYMTAVAVINHGNKTITTDKFYSKTTSKHINYVADLYNYKVVR